MEEPWGRVGRSRIAGRKVPPPPATLMAMPRSRSASHAPPAADGPTSRVAAADAALPPAAPAGTDSGDLEAETASAFARRFPILRLLEALDRVLREPTTSPNVDEALASVTAVAGVAGAYLEVDAPPLPALRVGHGTLRAGPPTGEDDASPTTDRADGIGARESASGGPSTALVGSSVRTVHELRSKTGGIRLGRLWLEAADAGAAELAVRALELALDAAWARASVAGHLARLEALDEASRAIAGELALERVLQLIVDRVRDLVEARYAALGIVDESGAIERFITSGISPAERARIGALPRGRGLLGVIIREGRSLRIPDIRSDPRSAGVPPHHPVMTSFLGVPVKVKGRPIGNLYLTDKIGAPEFSEADQRLVEMFALHAGIAIENARLHDRVRRLAIMDERERIGKDLHDGIIQSLYAVGLSLEDVPELMADDPAEAAARVDRAIESLNLTIRDIRNFIFGLRPELLEQADLAASIAALADEFRLNTLIDVELDLEATPAGIPAEARIQLLQIAREALSNIARHAKASRASVSVAVEGGVLALVVADNGRGFDPSLPRDAGHQGLGNMADRAAELGGELTIESAPGAGTRIIVRLPIDRLTEGS